MVAWPRGKQRKFRNMNTSEKKRWGWDIEQTGKVNTRLQSVPPMRLQTLLPIQHQNQKQRAPCAMRRDRELRISSCLNLKSKSPGMWAHSPRVFILYRSIRTFSTQRFGYKEQLKEAKILWEFINQFYDLWVIFLVSSCAKLKKKTVTVFIGDFYDNQFLGHYVNVCPLGTVTSHR